MLKMQEVSELRAVAGLAVFIMRSVIHQQGNTALATAQAALV